MTESLYYRRVTGFEQFRCPTCQAVCEYQFEVHTPTTLAMLGRVTRDGNSIEYVRCLTCDTTYRATILAAQGARRPLTVRQRAAEARVAEIGGESVVSLTNGAIEEIRQRLINGEFDDDTAVRLSAERSDPTRCTVLFDTLEWSDADTMQRAGDLFLVIDNRDLQAFRGATIDYRDGHFRIDFMAEVL